MPPKTKGNKGDAQHSSREDKRWEFVKGLIAQKSVPQAAADSGITPRTGWRIVKKLNEEHTVADHPRSGRPKVYTDKVFRRCLVACKRDEPKEKWMTRTLFNHLKALDILHPKANQRSFYKTWHLWLRQKNIHAQFHSRRTIFFLREEDKPKRLAYAKMMLQLMKENPLLHLVFVDETSIEHGGHPKSGGLRLH